MHGGVAWQLSGEAVTTAAALLNGLRSCSTLKHLSLGHRDLVFLNESIREWSRKGPSLETIQLWGDNSLLSREVKEPSNLAPHHGCFNDFMLALAGIQSLQAITIHVSHASVLQLESQVLNPLRAQPPRSV